MLTQADTSIFSSPFRVILDALQFFSSPKPVKFTSFGFGPLQDSHDVFSQKNLITTIVELLVW